MPITKITENKETPIIDKYEILNENNNNEITNNNLFE
jgi:hypothetical protein